MTINILEVLMFLTSMYGLVVGFILSFFSGYNNYNKRLLCVSIFSYSWYCLITVITYSGSIIYIPHLFRTGAPFTYLVAPASYLYVRATLNAETRPRNYDWIHLIPSVLVLVELSPFYVQDAESKRDLIKYYHDHRNELVFLLEGMFPKYVHFVFRTTLALFYFCFQWRNVKSFEVNASIKIRTKYKVLLNWLNLYTLLLIITFFLVLLTNLRDFYLRKPGDVFNMIIAIPLLIVPIILLFKPDVLYGLKKDMSMIVIDNPKPKVNYEKTTKKNAIDDLLNDRRSFLIKSYSLQDMADELNLSTHELSSIINHEYQMNFTNLVNKYRISYIIKRIEEGVMATYTIEGLAQEAGFSSRTTFYRAFFRVIGQTPTSFLKTSNKMRINKAVDPMP